MMPELDGVGFVREQMRRKPLPIIIMSIADENADAALNALESGAVDFVQKPTALATEKIFEVSIELIDKVKAAGNIPVERIQSAIFPWFRRHFTQTAPGKTEGSREIIPSTSWFWVSPREDRRH